jgi:hypothetical protein
MADPLWLYGLVSPAGSQRDEPSIGPKKPGKSSNAFDFEKEARSSRNYHIKSNNRAPQKASRYPISKQLLETSKSVGVEIWKQEDADVQLYNRVHDSGDRSENRFTSAEIIFLKKLIQTRHTQQSQAYHSAATVAPKEIKLFPEPVISNKVDDFQSIDQLQGDDESTSRSSLSSPSGSSLDGDAIGLRTPSESQIALAGEGAGYKVDVADRALVPTPVMGHRHLAAEAGYSLSKVDEAIQKTARANGYLVDVTDIADVVIVNLYTTVAAIFDLPSPELLHELLNVIDCGINVITASSDAANQKKVLKKHLPSKANMALAGINLGGAIAYGLGEFAKGVVVNMPALSSGLALGYAATMFTKWYHEEKKACELENEVEGLETDLKWLDVDIAKLEEEKQNLNHDNVNVATKFQAITSIIIEKKAEKTKITNVITEKKAQVDHHRKQGAIWRNAGTILIVVSILAACSCGVGVPAVAAGLAAAASILGMIQVFYRITSNRRLARSAPKSPTEQNNADDNEVADADTDSEAHTTDEEIETDAEVETDAEIEADDIMDDADLQQNVKTIGAKEIEAPISPVVHARQTWMNAERELPRPDHADSTALSPDVAEQYQSGFGLG